MNSDMQKRDEEAAALRGSSPMPEQKFAPGGHSHPRAAGAGRHAANDFGADDPNGELDCAGGLAGHGGPEDKRGSVEGPGAARVNGTSPRVKAFTPPRMEIRAEPPKARGLPSRKLLMSGAMVLGGLVAFALVTGLSPAKRARQDQTETAFRPATAPESVRKGPKDYSAYEAIDLGAAENQVPAIALAPPSDPQFAGGVTAGADWRAAAGGGDLGVSSRAAPPAAMAGGGAALRSGGGFGAARSADDFADKTDADARVSPITFGAAEKSAAERNVRDEMILSSRLKAPESAFILQAGSVIPAALRTALNSEAPGRVIAQVIAPVYDSLTGEHLLAPQGTRLLGTYEFGAKYGERRIRIVWNRLILPNGYSMDLQEMAAVDSSGAAGLRARVDDHVGRIAAASVISGALSTAANAAQDRESSLFAQSVGDAAAQEAARVGGRIVDRELDVRPTLRTPAGAKIKVLVERDLVFRVDAR